MSLEMAARQRLDQRMHLSQQMLQNLELLLLPALDLRDFIQKELEENPALEETPEADEKESPVPDDEEETPEAAARREMLESLEEQWFESERRTRKVESAEDADRRMDLLNSAAARGGSLKDHLQDQLLLLDLPDEMRSICHQVVEHLNDAGLLKPSIEEMVLSSPHELIRGTPEHLARKFEKAIAIIQSLEPPGVGGRSVKECLLLQLEESDPLTPLLRRFIERHLEDVAANRLPHIVRTLMADPEMMRDLGRSVEATPADVLEDVKLLISEVAKLNPRPGTKYSAEKTPRVFPEVVVRQVDGRLEIVLEDGWLPAISVSRTYEEMVRDRVPTASERAMARRLVEDPRLSKEDRKFLGRLASGKRVLEKDRSRCAELARNVLLGTDESRTFAALSREPVCSKVDREFIKHKVDAARKLIAAIEQRRGTIYRITEQILKRQAAFFESGIEHLRPLKMQEIADALGIHLSTVSRAVSEKWMETPQGVLPFRFFFASAGPGAELDASEGRTRLALLDKVRDIVESEDKSHPHSDLDITRILRQNYRISAARRTVAKYREELRFPSAKLRKCY